MSKRKYNVGDKFGKWTLLEYLPPKGSNVVWKVQCECGFVQTTSMNNITRSKSTQCSECKRQSMFLEDTRFGFPMSFYQNVYETLYHVTSVEITKEICKKLYSLNITEVGSIGRIDPREDWSVDNFVILDRKAADFFGSAKGIYLEYPSGKPVYTAKSTVCGKRKTKSFSVSRYGEDGARKLAEQQRTIWEDEIVAERKALAIIQGIIK